MLKYYYANLFLMCLGSFHAIRSKALPISLLLLAPCCFCYYSLKENFSNHIYFIYMYVYLYLYIYMDVHMCLWMHI